MYRARMQEITPSLHSLLTCMYVVDHQGRPKLRLTVDFAEVLLLIAHAYRSRPLMTLTFHFHDRRFLRIFQNANYPGTRHYLGEGAINIRYRFYGPRPEYQLRNPPILQGRRRCVFGWPPAMDVED